MLHEAKACGCTRDIGSSKAHISQTCEHGNVLLYTKALKRSAPLRQVSEKREGEGRRSGSTLKQGRGFAVHPAQRAKVKDRPCIVCGLDRFEAQIHAAHVYPRRFQSCDCAEGVVPLCAEHHRLYDDQNGHFDLLPHLVDRGYQAEFVHAVAVHHVPVGHLLEQVTGVEWKPVGTVAV